MDLAGVDLNLLVAFDALLDERSVTRAATRLSLSQPGMSNALAIIRGALDEPSPWCRKRAVPHLRRTADIRVLEPPVALPSITETLWWHPRHSASPAHQWIRERITEIAAELDQVPCGGNQER